MHQKRINIRNSSPSDRKELSNLLHFGTYVHRHLDWRAPLDWIGYDPFLIAENSKGKIVAALACPPDLREVAWIRLLSASHEIPIKELWKALWDKALLTLKYDNNIRYIAAIPLHQWFCSLLIKTQFNKINEVAVLSWKNQNITDHGLNYKVKIRPLKLDDIAVVREIDASSFIPIWQNSVASLKIALNQAVYSTVADLQHGTVGYQITTSTPKGGHLARIAVHPSYQNSGIGYTILHNLLKHMKKRGAHTVTVNTQKDNTPSLALYKKAGFKFNGEQYPIYQYKILD